MEIRDLAKLKAQFEAVKKKVKDDGAKAVKVVTLAAWQHITTNVESTGGLFGSPVLTGRYQASHRISIGSLDKSFEPEGSYAQVDFKKPLAALRSFRIGEPVFISQSVPYAGAIETGEASKKTPFGVYAVGADLTKAQFRNSGVKISGVQTV